MTEQTATELPEGVLSETEHKIMTAYVDDLLLQISGDRLMRLGVMRATAMLFADAASHDPNPASAVAGLIADFAHDVAALMAFDATATAPSFPN